MPRYARKSVTVDAEQFLIDKLPWPSGVFEILPNWTTRSKHRRFTLVVEGAEAISPGDWVVTNPTGEKYRCRETQFLDIFEPIGTKQ